MKRPIFYTLLAVLLVCFLTACQVPSDPPIAPQETTTGIIDPEETTKEPEETTLPAESDAGTEEPINYTYLPTLPNDKWYFDWTPTDAVLKEMEETRAAHPLPKGGIYEALKAPLISERATRDGKYMVKLEFFEEYHPSNAFIPVRVTITNVGSKDEEIQIPVHKNLASLELFGSIRGWNEGPRWFSPAEAAYAEESGASSFAPILLKNGESCSFDRILFFKTDGDRALLSYSHIQVAFWDVAAYGWSTSENFPIETVTMENGALTEQAISYPIDRDWINKTEEAPVTALSDFPSDKWYFSWTPISKGISEMKALREQKPQATDPETILKLPKRYEVTVDGLIFRFESYADSYTEGDFVQLRLTVVNDRGERVTLKHSPDTDARILYQSAQDAAYLPMSSPIPSVYSKEASLSIAYAGWDDLYQLTEPVTLDQGEGYTIDRVFYLVFPEEATGTEVHVRYYITVGETAKKLEILIPGALTDQGA